MKVRNELLEEAFWAEQGGASGWAKLLATAQEAQEARRLRHGTCADRWYGEDAYVTLFEEHFQRAWGKWGTEKASRADATAV